MSRSANSASTSESFLSDVFGVITDEQTYKNLLYIALAFPLGLGYYVILTVGFALGLGLSVLLIGLGILFGTVVGVRVIASFERTLANTLLGTEIGTPTDVKRDANGILEHAKAYLQASSTWRGLGFVFLKFWVGVLSFILLVSFLGTAVELVLLPVIPSGALNAQVLDWEVADTFRSPVQRAIAVPVGAMLGVLSLHILNAYAQANASIAASLLGAEKPETVE